MLIRKRPEIPLLFLIPRKREEEENDNFYQLFSLFSIYYCDKIITYNFNYHVTWTLVNSRDR